MIKLLQMTRIAISLRDRIFGGRLNRVEYQIAKYTLLIIGIIVAIGWTQYASPFRENPTLLPAVYSVCNDGPSYIEFDCMQTMLDNPRFLLYKLGDNIHAALIGLLIFYFVVYSIRRMNDTKYAGKYKKFANYIVGRGTPAYPLYGLNYIGALASDPKTNKFGPEPTGFSWKRLSPLLSPKKKR